MSQEQQLRIEQERTYLSRIPKPERRRSIIARSIGKGVLRFGKETGKGAFRLGRYGVVSAHKRAVGLTPSEYAELLRLRRLKRTRGLRDDELYIQEIRRLRELEQRYKGPERKQQAKQFYRRLKEGPPSRRLRA